MYSTLKKRTQVIVFSNRLFKSNAQQILGGQWCSQDRWEGYKAERNLCISMASVAPLAPSGQCSNVIPVPAPSALFPESRTQCLCSLPCPSLHHSSLGTQHSRYTVDCLAFILPPPTIEISPCIPSLWLPTVLIAVLRIQLCLAPRRCLTDTLWTIQPHCMCRSTITSLFFPFLGYSCPLVSMEIRSRTSCRHQSPWMLRLLI